METSKVFSPFENLELDEGYQKTYKNFDELLPTLPPRKGWWLDQLFQYQGFWLSSFALRANMLVNDHFKPRPTDIFVATSPKCGTTWLRALVFSIVNRNSFDFSDHPLSKNNPRELVLFLEGAIYSDGSSSFIDGLPSPRLLSTHLPFSLFPKRMTDDSSDCRFVYICRDPKDVFISKWHFANKLRAKELPPIMLEEAFDSFCEGVSHYGPFWDHVLGYWKASLESPKKVLFLKYEDVKKQPADCVRKVAGFLGVPFSPEEENKEIVEEIVKLCSFENMSNLEVNKNDTKDSANLIGNSDFFRKGEVGDWANHLSPQMAETLDQITEQKLKAGIKQQMDQQN
ncbi:sulfotransferase 16, CORONATINE INDUCED-7, SULFOTRANSFERASE 16, ARABIDOPSIS SULFOTRANSFERASE 5A [Hibiscus trionum]|uniref:Sulfotransferase n=1 Tax=Hibiscus trionum TaxID=183268 RepID=A0A9W7M5N0_HIBTR|nr:sulfotransferase 16, CORONATINE INDUCED-7, SULFOTRANSFERASE 16, ARABIDOPSIS SULFOTRANSFERASE 5A [Hibiscus trionum]